jgi:hypothetical protein
MYNVQILYIHTCFPVERHLLASDYPIIMQMMKNFAVVYAILQLAGHVTADEKCKVDDRVKFLLKNMNADTVKLKVDCVTGVGQCVRRTR